VGCDAHLASGWERFTPHGRNVWEFLWGGDVWELRLVRGIFHGVSF